MNDTGIQLILTTTLLKSSTLARKALFSYKRAAKNGGFPGLFPLLSVGQRRPEAWADSTNGVLQTMSGGNAV